MHIKKSVFENALKHMFTARAMADIYEANRPITSYVHSTSKGHEAIQLATAYHLKEIDWVAPYYRDESILLGMGLSPYELMLQLLAKKDDPFSGGRTYYSHPSLLRADKPKIAHQSSATGMQAIPTTGIAHGLQYLKENKLNEPGTNGSIVVCSIGDGSMTEGEVAEALQMAVLHQLPILYLVQDNDWGISASGDEMRAMNAYEFAAGFKGLRRGKVDGSDFAESYNDVGKAIKWVRMNQKPMLLHAKVPLLGHHTSGVRSEWYRDDLEEDQKEDPLIFLLEQALEKGFKQSTIDQWKEEAIAHVSDAFERAVAAESPALDTVTDFVLAPTPITEEVGERSPAGNEIIIMVDAALHAVDEILTDHPEALLYGQDVGHRLGGVFREAATLAQKHGTHRVFNTPIQEAYIIGSTAGMSAVGCKPIVEVQFADYIWPGVNQLVTELSKSSYLSGGKFPIQSVIRIPTGAYGGGGPYHSGTNESSILPIKGIKIVYPSNAADMKGLMKAAFYDPNPVVMFEHKGIYWSKVPGTEGAKSIEPSKDYVIPLGKARIHLETSDEALENGETISIITYGMGVWWASNAAKNYPGQVEVVDLRTLSPCDDESIYASVKKHGKVMVLTEETLNNSFAQAIAGRIQEHCFQFLDAPVKCVGSLDLPAVPLNVALEKEMLPNADKVATAIGNLLDY
ncbi:MAG: thiamine pyrophosphate-dependent enzyme [Bacteroidia bacterium]|jgi:2-oxoisovalerate dehydrogenase E1 component|tara:strand:+ start:965 stop:3016 length:2052 start_codon:yes stop_codon:yes gene_type:complete